MKTKSLLLVVGILYAFCSYSQKPLSEDELGFSDESNQQRYLLDYELVGYDFAGDSTVLELLPIAQLIQQRKPTEDVHHWNIEYDVEILIYSRMRSMEARGISIDSDITRKNQN